MNEVPYCPECGADCERHADHDHCQNEQCGAIYYFEDDGGALDAMARDIQLKVLQ